MRYQIIRIIAFMTILSLTLLYCCRALQYKGHIGIRQIHGLYEQEPDSIDVLILGSSHATCSFNTGTLWDEYGIAAYDLGGPSQPMWNTYYYLKEALKTQRPKLIIVEGYMLKQYVDYATRETIEWNTFGMKMSLDKINALLASIPKEDRRMYLPEFVSYHSRYSALSKSDFIKDTTRRNWKGYDPNTQITPKVKNDLSDITDRGYISDKSTWYFVHIIELAQQYNIPIEIVIAPYPGCYDDEMRVYNEGAMIAEEKGVPFLNCNNVTEEIGLDYSSDFMDDDHLNYWGGVKFTRYIGDQIKSRYDIPDRRGDTNYVSWQVQADDIRNEIKNQSETNAQ